MDALECLSKRISTRKYVPSTIKEADIKAILTAGFEAPSAMNRRPYDFIVNTENAFWHKLAPLKPTCDIIATTPLSIVIVGDSNKNPTDEFLIEDCSCCAVNMLNAAKALGYDSLWCGIKWHSEFYDELIRYFKLPSGDVPVAVLCFGMSGEKKVQVERYDEKKVHHGTF
jgi:nitroreductase